MATVCPGAVVILLTCHIGCNTSWLGEVHNEDFGCSESNIIHNQWVVPRGSEQGIPAGPRLSPSQTGFLTLTGFDSL